MVAVLAGVGYEAFYSRPGVRPADIAMGARDVVIHGALGVGLLLAHNGLLIAALVVGAIGWRHPRQPRRRRR